MRGPLLADVAHHGRDDHAFWRRKLRKGGLHRKLLPILATTDDISSIPHGTARIWAGSEPADVLMVRRAITFRHKTINATPNDLTGFVAEGGFCTGVEHRDPALLVGNDDTIGRSFEDV